MTFEELEDGEVQFVEPRDAFDSAILGIAERSDGLHVVAYDSERIVTVLMATQGWGEEEARDWFEENTRRNYLGPSAPVFVQLCSSND